jgi:outer membrane murein-binding lipoprotein Lpp
VTALLAFLVSNPTILAIGGGIIAMLVVWMRGRVSGAAAERSRQAGKDIAAAQDRLEMNREATDIERKTAGMTDDQARKEAAPWVRR